MLLYVIRHGDPDYSRDCLTELGRQQAEAVGLRLAKCGITQIYTSPMGRAQETAQPLCRKLGLNAQIEDWAHEIHSSHLSTTYPDGIPQSVSRLQNTIFRENGNMGRSYTEAFDCPGIRETRMREATEFLEREGNNFLARLGYREENGIYRIVKPNDDRVALFCHAATARAWISSLLRIPLHIMWASFSYALTGVTLLEFKNNADGYTAPCCLYYGDCGHLEGIG